MSFDSLPVIIVSAHTQTAADEIISEMIDADVTAEVKPAGHASSDRVWRLRNKYYTADVRVVARAASQAPREPPGPLGAHVLLLAQHELGAAEAASRLAVPAWRGAPADVNVLACRARALPAALAAECARRRLEPVALDAPGALAELRAALHAHVWPGLRRAPGRGAPPAPAPAGDLSSEGEDGDGDEDEEGSRSVEAAERFAAALGALGGGARHAAELSGAARLAAAEQLVAAFAAALGHDVQL